MHYHREFTGSHQTHDITAERLAIADALRSLASHLESTARLARLYDDNDYRSSFYNSVPPLPRHLMIITEKHEDEWVATVTINPPAIGETERLHG